MTAATFQAAVAPRHAALKAHTLFLRYARGIALGVLQRVAEAEEEQRAFLQLLAAVKPEDRLHHNVNLLQMGEIAAAVLSGELLYRKGELEPAFAALQQSVHLALASVHLRLVSGSQLEPALGGVTSSQLHAVCTLRCTRLSVATTTLRRALPTLARI